MSKEVKPEIPEIAESDKKLTMSVLAEKAEFSDKYVYDDTFKPGKPSDFRTVHTIPEMLKCLEESKDIETTGIFLEVDSSGTYRYRKVKSKKEFLEAWKANSRMKKIREAKHKEGDAFATDTENNNGAGANAGLVGDDYTPLLGGPFNKQPYLYDFLRAHAYCFQEYNHHPFARAIVHLTRDFVLGRGYQVDSDDQKALALWKAFEEVNNLEQKIEQIVVEGSLFGENLIWWLPNQAVNIAYNVAPGQEPQKGIIPRIRLIDPSTCWEIVTMPEDIERVLFYWLVFPSQYQIKTGNLGGSPVPSAKFIQQQLPASDVMHFKYNCMSNEKRGRSDLFPILGYLKWVKDCVNYKLISLKKQAAWTEDISVEGSQADVDNLTRSLEQLGAFEPAGSRFIHTQKIKREYMANQHGGGGDDSTLDWGINMISVGSQYPASYWGLMKSAGQTRASALVGTEPVAKKIQRRQIEVSRVIKALWRRFQDGHGVKGSNCRITFPEVITQDSSQKIKDIKLVEDCGYISHKTAAPRAAKELDLDDYDYETETKQIAEESAQHISPTITAPLTAPGSVPTAKPAETTGNKPAAVTQQDRKATKDSGGF